MRVPIRQIIFTYKELGNVTKTAKALGISRMTVYRWIRKAQTDRKTLSTRGLQRKSTKPRLIHTKLTIQEKLDIIKLSNITHIGARKLKLTLKLDSSPVTYTDF